MQAWPEYVFLCIRSSEPPAHFSNPDRWYYYYQHIHIPLRSTTLIVTVGAASRRSIGRPVEEARNLVEKFPAVSSDTVLIRTTYPICRSSFRLSSGPRNAGCFALFRFSFPWVFHENFYVYLAIGYCIYVLYSISYFLCMNYIHRSLVRCLKSLYLCSVSVWVP